MKKGNAMRIEDLLTRAKKNVQGKPSYICPQCGNGSGLDGTGITENPQKAGVWHCFKCGFNGDVYDIADIVNHLEPGTSFRAAYKAGKTDKERKTYRTHRTEEPENTQAIQEARKATVPYITQKRKEIHGSAGEAYLTSRGFDADFVAAYFGYDKERDAIVIPYPWDDGYYTLRYINPTGPKYYKPAADKMGKEPIFNGIALTDGGILFAMEGQIDALSILQAGGNAIAIGGGGDRKIEEYKGDLPETVYIIADNDDAGEDTAKRIKKAFKAHKKDATILHPPKGYKDVNDLLKGDRGLLEWLVRGHNWRIYERRSQTAESIKDFLQEAKTKRYEPIETGFHTFDRVTGGGLVRQSLVMLAAAPGQGKTTLAAQLFEGMARSGKDVIFINLEMSREQLIAKSLSRYAFQRGLGDFSAADIMRGYNWTPEQEKAITAAAEGYIKDIAKTFVYADRDETTASLDSIMQYITKAAEDAQAIGRPAPLVVLDYLHIVQTVDDRGREEDPAQAIKRTVTQLKAFAIKYKTVVFAILATNRESNKGGGLGLYSGRDTSNIEYSADMFITLQDDEEAEQGKYKPLKMRLEKNRLGEAGAGATFRFDAKHGIFTEEAPEWIPDRGKGYKVI